MFYLLRIVMTISILLVPALASAYVGPGAGLSAIGSVLALIGAVIMLIVGFLWYPIKRMLRKRKQSSDSEAGDSQHSDSGKE